MSENDNRPASKPDDAAPQREAVFMFNAREIGQSLSEVAVEHLKSDGRNIETRWYHSQHDADVFYWRDDQKNIIKQQVSFLGQLLEWNMVEGVRTGVIIESGRAADMSSPTIHFDATPQKKTIEQGLQILDQMTALDLETKRRIMRNFR